MEDEMMAEKSAKIESYLGGEFSGRAKDNRRGYEPFVSSKMPPQLRPQNRHVAKKVDSRDRFLETLPYLK